MQTITGYTEPGGVRYIKLDKDIIMVEAEKVCSDERKLREIYLKQKERDPTVLGVIVADNLLIKLKDTMRFEGIIWSTRKRLSGRYEFL